MRGGKREGAGRKRKEPTKMYRLPVEMEDKIKAMLEDQNTEKQNDRKAIQKSKEPVKPIFPILTNEQKRRLRIWLTLHKFAKDLTEARKITNTPKLTKETVLKHYEMAGEKYNWTITDIFNLCPID
ncbi:MAG: hypothetical protein Q8N96_04165 [Methylovulum sp.]|nr:hypothetical protein [Methylovulum sp.]